MKINESEITADSLKEYIVVGQKEEIVAIADSFDTKEEAETYIGIEGTQFESDGVKYSIYKKVE